MFPDSYSRLLDPSEILANSGYLTVNGIQEKNISLSYRIVYGMISIYFHDRIIGFHLQV